MSGSREDWNARTIAEFRRNHGKVGGPFEGAPLLLLHHIGARSGKRRVNPVMYLKDGGTSSLPRREGPIPIPTTTIISRHTRTSRSKSETRQ